MSWIVDEDGRVVAATPDAVGQIEDAGDGLLSIEGLRAGSHGIVGTGWTVRVGMPLAVYQGPATLAMQSLVLVGGVSVLLILLASFLIRREILARRQQDTMVAMWQRFDALSKLAGGLSHDFNNLLMGLQSGIAQLRRHRGDDQRFDKITALMLESVEKGKGAVQRLSGFTRQTDASAVVVEFASTVPKLLGIMRQAVREDIQVSADIADHLWPAKIDPQALEVALVNLAANARDAMANGGKLMLSMRNVPRAETMSEQLRGPHVVITVSDTGTGIAAEALNRVFDPFFSTKPPPAAGLGLSQVYGFARRSGGIATISSVPGAGTAVHILLPKAVEVARAIFVTPGLVGLRALVVDDDPVVAQSVADMLQQAEVAAEVVFSATEGLALLRERHFDVMVSDITMPEMSGLDLAHEARRLRPALGILLMTGYSDRLTDRAPSPFKIIFKPFADETLRTALSAVLGELSAYTSKNVVPLDRM
ncbi:response regulator [Devosia albogilva]|uniref:histidine kinase n=1 Tax=Devosia albogilva TaxID=429726 RepID=A0ABW5QFB9_9HYPH